MTELSLPPPRTRELCATMEVHRRLLNQSVTYQERRAAIENRALVYEQGARITGGADPWPSEDYRNLVDQVSRDRYEQSLTHLAGLPTRRPTPPHPRGHQHGHDYNQKHHEPKRAAGRRTTVPAAH
jgi:hypothetical protein